MQQQRKRDARKARRSQQRGGTFLGLVLGLIVGLAIAVVVALYITKSPTPFQQKNAPRPSEPGNVASQLPPPAQRADQGPSDPNKPLWSKTPAKPVGQAPEPEPKAGTQPSQQNGHQNGQPPVAVTRPAEKPVEKPVEKPADKPVATKPAEKPVSDPIAEIAQADANKVGYLLQVGAFRSADDADRQKANLAMQGFEARITERDVNGVKMYRVRMGPYNRIEDMNKTRERLQSQGFEASVIRFTKQ
ncbi:SPOR domain-containing protein [Cupriavidus oxalaticus]|uniref:Cell division protein FtsN n=1 Tax=Cupriavidus oxalaticus TaxID=96344 RepID=A0A375FRL7_9BURK|nr:SPOR domain-containing protein [Cupriavidus oxalaticus]QRQ87284.1 SPOR domain-containing protein [Cupriavidus oxalaticus]QRQ94388.1 SPOR domain-containing protein [Cupriavidus oxalaticus]WQD83029.1 SPOR domain-containing protein [Cupriavidus oxalaticus]SPC10973.1 Cell division protein FtsN [Cupriavidus oxalaticus]